MENTNDKPCRAEMIAAGAQAIPKSCPRHGLHPCHALAAGTGTMPPVSAVAGDYAHHVPVYTAEQMKEWGDARAEEARREGIRIGAERTAATYSEYIKTSAAAQRTAGGDGEKIECKECNGTGSAGFGERCSDCNGKGYDWEPVEEAAAQADDARMHDVVTNLREYASNPGYSHNDYADTMREAAKTIEGLRAAIYHYAGLIPAAPTAQPSPCADNAHDFAFRDDGLCAHCDAREAQPTPPDDEKPVASVIGRVGDDLRIGWLRPENVQVGSLLYSAPVKSAVLDKSDQWVFDLAAKHEKTTRKLFDEAVFSGSGLIAFANDLLSDPRAALRHPPVTNGAEPLDWPIPCDLVDGAVTLRKGVKLRTVLARMQFLSALHRASFSAAAQPTQAGAEPADPWHAAVLAECMRIECGYVSADPAKTLSNLIDWHAEQASAVSDTIKVQADNYMRMTCGAEPAAAATIERWRVYQGTETDPYEVSEEIWPDGEYVKYVDHIAAIAAAREEERKRQLVRIRHVEQERDNARHTIRVMSERARLASAGAGEAVDCSNSIGELRVIVSQETAVHALDAMRQKYNAGGYSNMYADDRSRVVHSMYELEAASKAKRAARQDSAAADKGEDTMRNDE